MAGISSKRTGILENRKKYNGIEFNNDLEINEYDAFFRTLDPEIGRWGQIDPKVDGGYESVSPYASNNNDPIKYSDPLGDEGEACCGGFLNALSEAGTKIMASASGVLWGSLNTVSGGLISTDPFNVRNTLSDEEKMYYDNAVFVGQLAPYVPVGGARKPAETPPLELVPVKVPPKQVPVKKPVGPETPSIPSQVNATHTKNARPSTKGKHEAGKARKKQNREGSGGMVNPPRKRPRNHIGPWPPKPKPPKPLVPPASGGS